MSTQMEKILGLVQYEIGDMLAKWPQKFHNNRTARLSIYENTSMVSKEIENLVSDIIYNGETQYKYDNHKKMLAKLAAECIIMIKEIDGAEI